MALKRDHLHDSLFPGWTPSVRVRRRGHAGQPGRGPEGKTCRDCAHYCRVKGGARRHLKCGLMEPHWTRGPGSDIRAKDPACQHFEAEQG
ncbi:MAG: hypothetical protein NXI21_01860 [Alphaproteobacteria bacterium]|nr:hypothetical protein [Alphaproteobacteria bacterium]